MQPRIYGGGLVVLSNQNNYVIPQCELSSAPRLTCTTDDSALKAFARDWTAWSRKPATVSRPADIDNEQLICRHGRFVVDLEREAERPKLISVVTEKQWNVLVKA